MQFQVNECTQRLDKKSEEIKTKHNTLQYIILQTLSVNVVLISFEKTCVVEFMIQGISFYVVTTLYFSSVVGKVR